MANVLSRGYWTGRQQLGLIIYSPPTTMLCNDLT